MKKQLIGTLVAAVILFLWQFLSWAILPVHQDVYGYTPNQDKIIEALSQNLTAEGTFMLPMPPPGSTREQQEEIMKNAEGKPWAHVSYHKSMKTDMGMNMFRGFTIDLVAAFLLIWLLSQMQRQDLVTAIKTSLVVGLVAYLTIPYLNSIWFEGSSLGHLADAIVPWTLVGAWLGWWMNRG